MINRLRENYTTIQNSLLNNENVSLKAKGLYAYLCSKPENWDFNYNGMQSQLKEGEKALRSAVAELVREQLLLRISVKGAKGSFNGWEWIINPTQDDLERYVDPIMTNGSSRFGNDRDGHDRFGNDHNGHDQNGNEISKPIQARISKQEYKSNYREDVAVVVSFWNELFSTKVEVDPALDRVVGKVITSFGLQNCKLIIDKYHRYLNDPTCWVSKPFTLFDFMSNSEFVGKIFHATDETYLNSVTRKNGSEEFEWK